MKTAEAIERITDAGLFEVLATRILRGEDSDYAQVEHLGVNAEGKTVKNPLDGFCKVPNSSPPKYVGAGFSTDKKEKIEKKLLFDHTTSKKKNNKYKPSDDGDLIKASRIAKGIRKNEPDAEFIFTFCTNKQPDEGLMQTGYQTGNKLGIDVRFLAQSRMRDYLDTTAAGQWLRKEHLEIEADQVSHGLLRELSKRSVNDYSVELFFDQSKITETSAVCSAQNSVVHSDSTCHVLIGESGCGKSVAAFSAMNAINDRGGICLWISAEVVEDSNSLSEAIAKAMHSYYPRLGKSCGEDFISLVVKSAKPCLLVIDDINRLPTARRSIQKVIGWQQRMLGPRSESTKVQHGQIQICVPVWRQNWWQCSSRNFDRLNEISIERPSIEEATDCVKKHAESIGQADAVNVANLLDRDPILIGIWANARNRFGDNPNSALVIQEFVDMAIEDATNSNLIFADIKEALRQLVLKMIQERNFYPAWTHVTSWMKGQIEAVRLLVKGEKVCRVVTRNNEQQFEFRHDRILAELLTHPIAEMIKSNQPDEVVCDPYFAEIVGNAIAKLDAPQHLGKISECNPFALIQAISHSDSVSERFALRLIELTRAFLDGANSKSVSNEVLWQAGKQLARINHLAILEVTETVKKNWYFHEARLVNGDSKFGKYVVRTEGVFSPTMQDWYTEDCIKTALEHHSDSIREQLIAEIEDESLGAKHRNVAITLAGYLGDPRLADPVFNCWENDNETFFVSSLWAQFRCAKQPDKTLLPILNFWASLSDEQPAESWKSTDRFRVSSELKFVTRHGFNKEVVAFLVERSKADERLRQHINVFLQRIDDKDSIAWVAQQIAEKQLELKGTEYHSPWAMTTVGNWDPLWNPGLGHIELSHETKNAIFQLWKDCTDEDLKPFYLSILMRTCSTISELRAIVGEVTLPDSTHWRRGELGDRDVRDAVLKNVKTDSHWFYVAKHIWDDEFFHELTSQVAEFANQMEVEFLDESSNHAWVLSEMVQDLDVGLSLPLVKKHWHKLRYSKRFVQVACYIGDNELLDWVEKTVEDSPKGWDPFDLVGSVFGFKTTGKKNQISRKQISNLCRFLQHIDDMIIREMIEWLVDKKLYFESEFKILKSFVDSEIANGKLEISRRFLAERFPTANDIHDQLNEQFKYDHAHWFAQSTQEHFVSPEEVIPHVKSWFEKEPNEKRLSFALTILGELGSRSDFEFIADAQKEFGNENTALQTEGVRFKISRKGLL